LKDFFQQSVLPHARQFGWEVLVVYGDTPAWEALLAEVFSGLRRQPSERQYYAIRPQALPGPLVLPEGFRFVPADAALLGDPGIAGLEELREEMCSERDSVEEFLEKSFGLCPLFGNQLAGWCLSEYNIARRCEIGIATLPPYQRRGLATLQTLAFLDQAARQGYQEVGWHCYARNLPSAATARKAGLALVKEYTSYLIWLNA
jgi:GNAT superfamily N-acetyltransferase